VRKLAVAALAVLLAGCSILQRAEKPGERQVQQEQPRKRACASGSERPATQSAAPANAVADRAGRESIDPAHLVQPDIMLVNGLVVTPADVLEPIWNDLERLAGTLPPEQYRQRAQQILRLRLREVLNEFLLWHEVSKRMNKQLSDALDRAADDQIQSRINSQFAGSQARFERYLAEHGLTLEDYKQQVRRRIAIVQYLRETITPRIYISRRELVRYFEQHKGEFSRPARIDLQVIDIPIRAFLPGGRKDPTSLRRARAAARKQAEQALAELKSGKDFAEVAKKYSKGIHAAEGGRWGTITAPGLRGRWAEPSKVAFSLPEGRFSDIIETGDGFFIVRAERKYPAVNPSFEEVQPQIEEKLRNEMFGRLSADLLVKLYSKANVAGFEQFYRYLLEHLPQPKAHPIRPAAGRSGQSSPR